MPDTNTGIDELNLHYTDGDPDLGIAPEGVSCKDMDEIVKRIEEVKDTVKKIILDNQRALEEIPVVLSECKQLEELDISHTNIREIPDFLFTLPALRSLSCCCRELLGFPRSLFKAEKLESLHLRINKDWTLPNEITSLQNLKVLAVDLYSGSALPEKLGTLTHLEELSLAIKHEEGTVPFLPASFKNHPALKKVNINDPFYRNRKTFDLEHAVGILSSCKGLESLKLSGFAVGKGHQNLSNLTGLKELELRHLLVEGDIFGSIAALEKLEKLYILGSEFKITKIPDIFTKMNELRVFSLAGNIVIDLPPSIYKLSKLSTLEIGSTGISSLDEGIAGMQSLENIHVYDNILEKLPDAVFTLPNLKLLNIEENIFNPKEIAAIKEKLNALAQKGRKIELMCDGQGHRQMVKRLRAIKNVDAMDTALYARYCLNAVNENPYAIKYVNNNKLQGSKYYAELCMAAVRKTCFTLENIDAKLLDKSAYFYVCLEAAKSHDIGNAFKLIRNDLINDYEYIQVCIEAALHNRSADFLDIFNNKAFLSHYGRETYERVCWVAVLHYPPAISKMADPTNEIKNLAAKRGYKSTT
ncbi:MAG: hypothetical protein LBQ89_07105 [Treponema sp.]|jgi:Leucine-rich repeat (LRR) protein|nr:hypothetical protein [Treponema sp.]